MRRGRAFLVVALICAVLATGAVQSVAQQQRRQLLKGGAAQGGSSLANMDSFALALLLGGLRGPLVMFLWMQSEASKSNRDLGGVETQIEWIRLLQPEFDTVHLFQIWNKAYNISAQIAGWAGKYLVILDAVDYINNIERQRPDNVNILSTKGGIFNDKLGGSQEKAYYDRRVREDTKWRQADPVRFGGSRLTRLSPMLNEDGTIRKEYLEPRLEVPAAPDNQVPTAYDGSELQFLKRYQPFPYGIPARALGYNYLKRSQVLQATTGQQHLQMGAIVVDSRPALTLRQWADAELDRGIAAEARLLGISLPTDRFDTFLAAAKSNPLAMSPEQIKSREVDLREAITDYSLSVLLMQDALTDFRRHLAIPEYQMHVEMYQSHLDHLEAAIPMVQADLNLLKAVGAAPAERQRLLADARVMYTKAIRGFKLVRLCYFSEPQAIAHLLPPGTNRKSMNSLSDAQVERCLQAVNKSNNDKGYDPFADDVREYHSYAQRAQSRLAMIGQ